MTEEKEEDIIGDTIRSLKLQGKEADDFMKNMEVIMKDVFEKGFSPAEAMGLTRGMIEGIYTLAHQFYNSGSYDQALQLFRLLVLLAPQEAKNTLGMAACFHMKMLFEEASAAYIICGMIAQEDPMPYYYASDCYTKMNRPDLALTALEEVLRRIKGKDKYNSIKDRVLVSIEALKQVSDDAHKEKVNKVA